MAATWCTRLELFETLEEYAGHKAGLALTRSEILSHLPDVEELDGPDDASMRIRLEDLEAIVRELLYKLGAVKNPAGLNPTMALYEKYGGTKRGRAMNECLEEALFASVRAQASARAGGEGGPVDVTPVAEALILRFGRKGKAFFEEFCELFEDYRHGSIITGFRRTEWRNIEELADLFESESLGPEHGVYIDQRFIDYLERNRDALDKMNWRKFEGLVAEYFDREGFTVKLSEGRGDGGVDLRVWREKPVIDGAAPTILVQCKRQKKKVGQVVVKALWADVVAEKAESGLVVTTSALEPGAARVCVSRGYPVRAAERKTLIKWLEALRTPGRGLLLV